MKMALKELRESQVWIRIVKRLGLVEGASAESAIAECDELIAIFVTSIATAKRNQSQVKKH
jgi:four helix bundle protein